MQLTTHAQAADFLTEAQDYLLRHEVVSGLLLGIALRLVDDPHGFGPLPPYFATVKDDDSAVHTGSDELVLCAVMTPPFYLILYADGEILSPALALVAHDLAHGSRPVSGVIGPVSLATAFAQVWTQQTGGGSLLNTREHLYQLTRVMPPARVPGFLRPANEADTALVTRWLTEFHDEAQPRQPAQDMLRLAQRRIAQGTCFIWDDDGPVALAGSTRPTLHGVSVGPVYTPPARRRRGYASACVAALSQRLLDQGYQFCSLFTDVTNPTSNAIYRQIGYRPVCDFQEILFTSGI